MEWNIELKDFITGIGILLSSILFIINWIVLRKKDMSNEKHKARIVRREELVKSFLSVDQILKETSGKVDDREPEFTKSWVCLCGLMHLYGTKEENDSLSSFATSFMGKNKSVKSANEAFNDLKNTLIENVRKELGFNK